MSNVNDAELLAQQTALLRRDQSMSRFKVEKVEPPVSTGRDTASAEPVDSLLADTEDYHEGPLTPLQTPPLEEIYSKRISKQVQFTVGVQDNVSDASDRRASYAAQNAISFRNMQTVEKVPHIDHYRNMLSVEKAISSRPTLAELHEADMDEKQEEDEKLQSFVPTPEQTGGAAPSKLGWIQGVLVRCILCILGVMLYLRLSWVAAQAGIGFGCLIVLLGSTVTTLTSLSLCAISTNGEVKGGGAYFLLSRSLGPEFGGSIGIIFSFANAVAAAMYMVGFAESLRDLLKEHEQVLFDGSTNFIRFVALCTAIVLLGVVMVGVQFETKAQIVLLFVLGVSIISFLVGTLIPPTPFKQVRGVTGYSWATFRENFTPDWRKESFFSVFAVYFPAATGIMAGANISGDLANPQKAIPKGTLLAILITTIIYLTFVTVTGAVCLRDASGNDTDLFNDTLTDCLQMGGCRFGLHNYFQVIELVSAFGPLVTAGVFAATLSSALASLVSAPKIFQALCKDRLFPYITFFAKGYGSSDEPRRGYLLSFFIACCVILIGDLNAIAPIISNFFLASYALINYACFDASFAKQPGFRPAFKFYNMWLSLFGAIVCMAVMFLISWWTALITYAVILALYVWLLRRKPEVNWGSSSQAHAYRNALNSMLRLTHIEEHVKNYRPQILVLSGNPMVRSLLVDFAANITKETSLLICGHVIVHPDPDRLHSTMQKLSSQMNNWLQKRRTRAFYLPIAARSLDDGAHHLLQLSGLGKLKPNILLLGFKNDWRNCSLHEINEYVNVIHYAFDHMLAVGVLRLSKGFDFSAQLKQSVLIESKSQVGFNSTDENAGQMSRCPSFAALGGNEIHQSSTNPSFARLHHVNGKSPENLTLPNVSGGHLSLHQTPSQPSVASGAALYQAPDNAVTITVETKKSDVTPPIFNIVINEPDSQSDPANEELMTYINQFQHKIKKAVIDVYWLFDDGGLSLLIPNLLTHSKSYLEGSKLRVFTIATSRNQLEQEQRSMAALLSKFRIDYADVYVIPDITRRPKPESLKEFETLIEPLLESNRMNDNNNHPAGGITEAELLAQKDRTYRQIRIRELLLKHSSEATLIVLTMPIPRRSVCSSALYMAWLETLSHGLPPILLMRGNQQSVLTFYS